MKDPKFTVADLRVISTAGAGLLKWVLAMVNYFGVAKDVEPKRRKVAESEKSLRQSQKELAVIKVEPTNRLLPKAKATCVHGQSFCGTS